MTWAILLDTGPLGQITHPKAKPKIEKWLKSLRQNVTVLRVPEISDYELRRELIRAQKHKSIQRLDRLGKFCFIPLTSQTMKLAAELWARARNRGQPTASNDSLDGDVILAAQAIEQLKLFERVTLMTINVGHLLQFQDEGIEVADWVQIFGAFE